MNEIIRLEDIEKTYINSWQEIHVLFRINLTIRAGESIALLGSSGSGKSTLMNILGLLDIPTSGKYFLKNENVAGKNIKECAKIRNEVIGFVFQRFHLLPYLTAQENVALPLSYRGICTKERMKKAATLLERFAIDHRMNHMPTSLSGGQCQRVAIARALITNPDIILADEPTGNLDSVSGQQVLKIFKELQDDGKTLIVVTHDYVVSKFMDRTLIIKDGHIENK